MDIKIKYSSKDPIYLQIKNQIRDAILNDELDINEPLPSIRFLAKELKVSVITTKRAYDELEKEGLINTVAGKGSFIKSQDPKIVREKLMIKIEEYVKEINDLAKIADISKEEIVSLFDILEDYDG
ncbi:GntR family transcriptional regulator [Anaerococcus urinomassiliensis]|uniref:GntR family transcriptional regulator n=1 Tax=Anaerococcus urinomassiliensis TaxID=1745712 RepID=UPI00093D52E0|nr:GntR family transcriptional regulator [Anaerococcus urinomassiliensis]